jgi:hypothetical protein
MTMWTHYCPCEKTDISVEDGEPCNWCDTPEPELAGELDQPRRDERNRAND